MMPADLASILARPVAHRGLHDRSRGIIENSLAAAEAAVSAGYGIECDIQLSRDGEAMVFHDETLERLTGATGPLFAQTATDLAAIELTGGIDRIPPLPAFLTHIAGRVPLVIEIKSRFDGDLRLATRAVALIAGYRGAVALKSFDAAVIAHCRARGASCPLGLVGPSEEGLLPPPGLPTDFLSWNVANLAVMRQVYPSRPAMSWTVRSRDDHAMARHHTAQIVFERYDPRSLEKAGSPQR